MKKTNPVNNEQEPVTRAEIQVFGDVQEAGYRATILPIARRHKLKGLVENMPDGSVGIIAEGPKEILQEFIEEIDIRNGVIEVEKIDLDGKYHTVSGELTRIRKAVEGGLTIKERKVEYSAEEKKSSGMGEGALG